MRDPERARVVARLAYRSRGFRAALLLGWRAYRHGLTTEACPYPEGAGWAAVWRAAWIRGYHAAGKAPRA